MSGKLKTFLIALSAVFLWLPEGNATHIVGGDMTYKCLGDNYFEVTLTFTRDCEYGADDARFDDPALVAIYDQYLNPVSLGANGMILIPFVSETFINTSLDGDCEVMGDEVCVHQTVYRDTIFLLPKSGGYIFSYKRCCRNSSLRNIIDPLQTGSTQMIHITEKAMEECNSSPVFKNWPDIYICNNQPIYFDNSATDADGDSLAYRMLTPYEGASVQNPKPDRFDEFDIPFEKMKWADGYDENNMMGGTPLAIDPVTGLLTGMPSDPGQYVIGVMVEEYRDGELLSVVRRDFQYNVRLCLDPPVADFSAPDVLCGADDFTVNFINTSQNANSYYWEFDYPDDATDKTSFDENPSYTYPNNPAFDGKDTFLVYLKAIRDVDGCFDTIIKEIVVIEDELIADFEAIIEDCPDDSLDIHLKDLSVDLNPSYTVDEWIWTVTLEDGSIITGSGKDYYITIPKQKVITVKLEIGSIEGCTASIEREVELIFVELEFIANPVVFCKGDSSKLVANPNSNWTYTWDPEEGLTFDDVNDKSDPWCAIEHDTMYYVTVTDGVCTIEDSVQVLVQDYLDISIEGPDFVCEEYITLIALGGEPGITIFEWSENNLFDPVIAEGDTVTFYINGYMKEYFLRVKEGTGCSNTIDSLYAFNNAIDIDYPDPVNYCFGTEREITVTNNRPNDTLVYTWEASPYIISALDSNVVTIYSDTQGEFELYFHVINQYGCESYDTIHVLSNEGPCMELNGEFECDTYTYCFDAFCGAGTNFQWDFGVPDIETDVSTEQAPCYDYPGPGTYTVTVTAYFAECDDEITLTLEVVVPDFFELTGQDTIVYCEGETLMLSVVPSNFSMDITWFNEDGDTIGNGIMIEYTPNGDENILIVGVDTFGCVDSLEMFLDMFEFDLSKDNPGTLCRGDTITLAVYNNSGDPLSYEWEADSDIISPLDQSEITVVLFDDNTYNVVVTSDEYGCTTELSIPVEVSWVEIDIEADTLEIVINKTLDLTVVGDYDPGSSTILWSTGESTETITITEPDEGFYTYCVTVTDEFGCFDIACIETRVWDPPCNETDIFIPNAFSPNDDDDIANNNDIFRPRGRFLEEVEILIYNRWGEEMFSASAGPNTGGYQNAYWDGTYNGEYLGPDAFAYIIRIVCEDLDTYQAQGNISIIK